MKIISTLSENWNWFQLDEHFQITFSDIFYVGTPISWPIKYKVSSEARDTKVTTWQWTERAFVGSSISWGVYTWWRHSTVTNIEYKCNKNQGDRVLNASRLMN